mgnify:CR=1 FL=1
MEFSNAIEVKNLTKKYSGFLLDVPELVIPEGFATALVGENGAGKTTLMNILSGIRLDYKGDIKYFGTYTDKDRENGPEVKEKIGYVGSNAYYFPQWTIGNIKELSKLLFGSFDAEKFDAICEELAIFPGQPIDYSKKNSALSEGNKMKLRLAGVLARDTEMLILDEPASPLDPLMRDKLCQIIRNYIDEGDGKHTAFYSTHDIADMENVTDYVIIIEHGTVVEQGFAEDLKEKYVLVKGDSADTEKAKEVLYTITTGSYGFEGMCLAENLDKLAGMDIIKETPTLSQICIAVMKAHSKLG